ncbi:MAG: hypothetical protein Kow006_09560 [Gammaproteobacteria bacterium]
MKPLIQIQLNLIIKVSLATAATATAVLIILISVLDPGEADDYLQLISATVLKEEQILPATLIAGLCMIIITALLTGLIALYSTFRVAGPLYRFARNVEEAIRGDFGKLVSLRRSDVLQEEWLELKRAADTLNHHYDALHEALDGAMEAESAAVFGERMKEVTTLVERVRV